MISDRLKADTRARHDEIEASMAHLMSRDLTRETYVRLLERFFGFHADFEARVQFADAALQSMFDDRRRLAALRDDLITLGANPDTLPLPTGACRLDLGVEASMLGAWYVLEGSTLGGQVICRHIESHLGLPKGLSYFRGTGPMTMPRWKAFKAVLDNSVAAQDESAAVASANETFEKLGRWLKQALPSPGPASASE